MSKRASRAEWNVCENQWDTYRQIETLKRLAYANAHTECNLLYAPITLNGMWFLYMFYICVAKMMLLVHRAHRSATPQCVTIKYHFICKHDQLVILSRKNITAKEKKINQTPTNPRAVFQLFENCHFWQLWPKHNTFSIPTKVDPSFYPFSLQYRTFCVNSIKCLILQKEFPFSRVFTVHARMYIVHIHECQTAISLQLNWKGIVDLGCGH